MALVTAEEWLPVLTKALDDRAAGSTGLPSIGVLRSYCDGNAPMPEMGQNVRASWIAFQKKARINYGGLACRALKNRIRPLGVRVGTEQDDPALLAAQRIWRDNRFATQVAMAINDRLQVRVGYLAISRDEENRAVVTREKPEFFYAATDPLQPWKARAAIKVWRDAIEGFDYAWVWVIGGRQKFVRPSKDSKKVALLRASSKTWTPDGDPEPYDGKPPIVILERPDGHALIEEHIDALDAINLGKLQRLVITAMQAFRQRGIKGNLPQKDADDNDIDWAKVFEPAPGALWDLPEGVDVWESAPTDIRPLLDGEKADRRDFAAVSSTPLSVFIPEGDNQSAEGAANAKEGHIALAQDEIDDIRPGVAMAMVYALRAEGVDLADKTVEVDFAPPALVSLSEQWAAAVQAKSAGVPLRTIMRKILGWSPDEIRLASEDIVEAQLDAAILLAQTTPENTAA